tara:strand:- start:675 stop:1061 length:387 start_codon:yes stop_codon:yes gene_type:complete
MRTIKWIVKTTSSYSDLNGNTYHFAQITRTSTGKTLAVETNGAENAAHLMTRRNDDGTKPVAQHNELYTVAVWEKRKEWSRLKKFARGTDGTNSTLPVYEHLATPAMLRALSSAARPEYTGADVDLNA